MLPDPASFKCYSGNEDELSFRAHTDRAYLSVVMDAVAGPRSNPWVSLETNEVERLVDWLRNWIDYANGIKKQRAGE